MKTLLKIIGALLALLVVVIAFNWPSDADMAAHQNKQRVEAACEQMMSDSALGNERRMTREMCDQLKARAEQRLRQARSQ